MFHAVDTSEASERSVFLFPDQTIDSSSSENTLESEINGEALIELDENAVRQLEEGGKRPPGIYIDVANQGGLSSLSVLVMYSINTEGSFHPILFKQCSATIKTHFRDKIRIKKKSGFFSSKIKIKRVLKVFTESDLHCSEILPAGLIPPKQGNILPLEVVEGRSDDAEVRTRSRQRNGSFIDSFRKAISKIHALRSDTSARSVFPNLDLGHYTFSVENRVRNPKIINQGPLKLCGPAAFIYLLASIDPEGFATVALNLITKGSAQYKNLSFIPHPDMIHQQPGSFRDNKGVTHVMDDADWLMMSALRDAENPFFWPGYDPKTNSGTAALTTHWELSSWLSNIDNVKEQRFSGSLSPDELNAAFDAGKRIVLLVVARQFIDGLSKEERKNTAQGFEGKMSAIFAPVFGDHFVVIDSHIQVSNAQDYTLTVWTWGDYREVTISRSEFEDTVKATFIITE